MTAIFKTVRNQSPTGPVFHIERTRKRKLALDPKDREAIRCQYVTKCAGASTKLPEVDNKKV